MENTEKKDNLNETIAKILSKSELEAANESPVKKGCKKCGKGNSEGEKKCRTCNEVKKKISPLILVSLTIFAFTVYGIYKAVIEIMSSFSQ
jgi:hypothetical protein